MIQFDLVLIQFSLQTSSQQVSFLKVNASNILDIVFDEDDE